MLNLDAIMSTDVVTLRSSDSLADARAAMRRHRIRHLPVVGDDGRLVGLLTQTDLLAATDSFLHDDKTRLHAADIPVSDVMVTRVVTVDPAASLRRAALFLEQHRIGCLPVVSDGHLLGIVTDTDFVGVAINLLEQLEEVEPVEEIEDD